METTMKGIALTSVLCLILLNQYRAEDITEYKLKRLRLIEDESKLSLGNTLHLSDKEILANEKLLVLKTKENSISGQYFTFRESMMNSKGYKMIRKMPKGAALHVHGSLMLDPNDLLRLTYEEHLYACLTEDYLNFHFSDTTPNKRCSVPWILVEELRMKYTNVTEFDEMLKKRLTFGPEDIGVRADENVIWNQFGHTISIILSLIGYRPVREKMIFQSLQNLYDDNVLYVEMRMGLFSLYELNGTRHDKLYMVSLHDEVAKKFMEANPDFAGLKLILTPSRKVSLEQMEEELKFARKVKDKFPDLIAGFDLVGQEDQGKPLIEFLPVLLEAKDELDYFFHAGETNQYGTAVDENLFDAVLLGSKRIGHANALIKHPALVKAVQSNDIALEVNVISNSVLGLVQDLRSHPVGTYLALGLAVVLSSDDPGVWGGRLSDDFYVTFVTIASRQADLRLLKQLAINSIRYSALDDRGKTKLFSAFEKKWMEFINDVNQDSGTGRKS